MKTSLVLGIILLFSSLVLVLVAATFNQPEVPAQNLNVASLNAQITPTPIIGDASVIGSTNGILIMGFVIMLIITVPVIIYKRNK